MAQAEGTQVTNLLHLRLYESIPNAAAQAQPFMFYLLSAGEFLLLP